jgi:hypothetical protein
VEVVYTVALSRELIATKVDPENRIGKQPGRAGFTSAKSRPPNLKETGMKSRVLSLITFQIVLWFWVFSPLAYGQQNTELMKDREDLRVGISPLQQQARDGDRSSQYLVGWSYMTGTGVSEDYREAAKWYRKSAARGFPDAEFALGYLYEQGKGVRRDYHQAALYYATAAKHGHAMAKNNLGSLYEHGQGLRKDLHQAACLLVPGGC